MVGAKPKTIDRLILDLQHAYLLCIKDRKRKGDLRTSFSWRDFNEYRTPDMAEKSTYRRRIGSWLRALDMAGIRLSQKQNTMRKIKKTPEFPREEGFYK